MSVHILPPIGRIRNACILLIYTYARWADSRPTENESHHPAETKSEFRSIRKKVIKIMECIEEGKTLVKKNLLITTSLDYFIILIDFLERLAMFHERGIQEGLT